MDEQQPNANGPSESPLTLDYAPPAEAWTLRAARRRLLSITWVEWTVVVAIVAVLLAILRPVFQRGETGTPRIHCMSNLRQIGEGLEKYAASNGGVYPTRLADICLVGVPPGVLVCPTSKTETPALAGATPQQTVKNVLAGKNHVTYIYLVGGMKVSSLRAGAVAAYEPLGDHSSGSRGEENVLFADGHVTSIPVLLLKRMMKDLKAGQNPPAVMKGY